MDWIDLYRDRKDERVVEYSFVERNIKPPKNGWEDVLDVGCLDSDLGSLLHEKGYGVTGIDIRQPPKELPFRFINGDIRSYDFVSEMYAQILCISTVEHIGIKAYHNPILEPDGDLKAMSRIWHLLRFEAHLILTVPFCNHKNDYWIRYYNSATLGELVYNYIPLVAEFYKQTKDGWVKCDEKDAEKQGINKSATPRGVACLMLKKE